MEEGLTFLLHPVDPWVLDRQALKKKKKVCDLEGKHKGKPMSQAGGKSCSFEGKFCPACREISIFFSWPGDRMQVQWIVPNKIKRHAYMVVIITVRFILFAGQKIVVVRCDGINISGSFYRNKRKLKWFQNMKQHGAISCGDFKTQLAVPSGSGWLTLFRTKELEGTGSQLAFGFWSHPLLSISNGKYMEVIFHVSMMFVKPTLFDPMWENYTVYWGTEFWSSIFL